MDADIIVKIQRVSNILDIDLPLYMTEGSSGMDLRASIEQKITIDIKESAIIPTGFAFELPKGFELQLRPRSVLAVKHGITIPCAPATIDSDYRGEVMVQLFNFGNVMYQVKPGDRIAQIVLNRVYRARLLPSSVLGMTARGSNGFGSTGVS